MQAFGFLTLIILMFMSLEIELVSSNPCSQFSDPNRQSLCTSDNYPSADSTDEE
ncbi:hypothetical protein MGMO_50c00190 [Methyloglobulus morosus KoM1]|uniref:Uncharacterized protein n=1 Tax=Methyloglobulus morosus KoM1 TaxID=1116472 RepID=V5C7J4_9GAMM|nr:hypothetical protein MGMO_50c00190 [Methyloglobulus morosus KoM1]